MTCEGQEPDRFPVLACRSTAGSVSFDDARVWATKVGSLHGLPVPVD